jgi:hypothetical protein
MSCGSSPRQPLVQLLGDELWPIVRANVFRDAQRGRRSAHGLGPAFLQGDSSWKTVKHIRTVFGSILEAAVRDDLLT